MSQVISLLKERVVLLHCIFHHVLCRVLLLLALVTEDSLCSEHGWKQLSILLDLLKLSCQVLLILSSLLQSRNVPSLESVSLIFTSFLYS